MGLLRLILALSIVVHHSNSLFGIEFLGREAALRGFYIISGFYMALILNEKYVMKDNSYFLFISNRFLRIFPIYWIALGLTLLYIFFFFYLHLGPQINPIGNYSLSSPDLPRISFNFSDIILNLTVIIRRDIFVTSDAFRSDMILPQAQTLVLEFLFYLVAPFIVRRKTKIILFLLLLSLVIRYINFGILRLNNLPIGDWFFPGMIVYFLLGVVSYKLYLLIKNKKIPESIQISLFAIIIFFSIFYTKIDILRSHKFIWSDYTEWLYLLLLTATIPFVFLFDKNKFISRICGELSYPVYILHILVILILTHSGFIDYQNKYLSVFLIIFTLLLSLLVVKLVEIPIDKIRQARVSSKKLQLKRGS